MTFDPGDVHPEPPIPAMLEQLEAACPWGWSLIEADVDRCRALVGAFYVEIGQIPVDGQAVFYVEIGGLEVVDAAETLAAAVRHMLEWMRDRQLDLQAAMCKAAAAAWQAP